MKQAMVVDDALFMRMAIKALLAKHGYDVVGEADNGAAAFRAMGQQSMVLEAINLVCEIIYNKTVSRGESS